MREYLTNAASILGQAGKEIFPKQSEILVERGDVGNFLNMPYFGGNNTTSRYAYTDSGEKATLEEFYKMYEDKVQSLPLQKIKYEKPSSPIKDGPPCLQTLCSQGFPEGTRNNGLFNIALYLKKANPSDWQDKVMEYNQKYLKPPLGVKELQQIITTHEKKEYFYKCKDAPINSFCNSSVCRTRKHGVGNDGPDTPQMSCLVKYNSEPPLWFLDVNGAPVELDTESLQKQARFQILCMEQINFMPRTISKIAWETMMNNLLMFMVNTEGAVISTSDDTSIRGQFYDLLEEYTTHMQQALDREEILLRRPWTDEKTGRTYFRLKDLEAYLKRNKFFEYKSNKIAQRLRDIDGKAEQLRIKDRSVRCWSIPSFEPLLDEFSSRFEEKEEDLPF